MWTCCFLPPRARTKPITDGLGLMSLNRVLAAGLQMISSVRCQPRSSEMLTRFPPPPTHSCLSDASWSSKVSQPCCGESQPGPSQINVPANRFVARHLKSIVMPSHKSPPQRSCLINAVKSSFKYILFQNPLNLLLMSIYMHTVCQGGPPELLYCHKAAAAPFPFSLG